MKLISAVVMMLTITAAIPLVGCATYANGSAPTADPTAIYVVGQRAGRGSVWVCPATPNGQRCQLVPVVLH